MGIIQMIMAAGGLDQYLVEKSLRFNDDDSAYFSRSQADGNRKTYTISWWMKWSKTSTNQRMFGTGTGASQHSVMLDGSDRFYLYYNSSSGNGEFTTARSFRDPSGWYHFVFAVDTTQITASNRMKLWVNGVQQTDLVSTTYPNQNVDMKWNYATPHYIGRYASGYYFGGYMAELFMTDGTAYDADTFGETDETTGKWIPKDCSADLTYGTNGCYLKFTSSSLGEDFSGEDHDWTPVSFTVTDSSNPENIDVLTDSPTSFDDSGNGTGNYCTWNPLCITTTANSLAQGNLEASHAISTGWVGGLGTNGSTFTGTIGMTSGKWYFEVTPTGGSLPCIGITPVVDGPYYVGYAGNGVGHSNTSVYNSDWPMPSTPATPSSFTTGDVLGVAVDMDNGFVWFSINGTWQNSGDPTDTNAASNGAYGDGFVGETMFPAVTQIGGSHGYTVAANFGQRPFAYTPPSGFKALNTYNLPDPTITDPSKHFDIGLDTGANILSTATGLTDGADFVWIKDKDNNYIDHQLFNRINDSDMNGTPNLACNDDYTETEAGTYAAPTGDGVAWVWNAGTANVTDTSTGSIDSTYRANPSAGFSVVTYTGNLTAGATVAHGLGAKPSFMIVKNRVSSGEDWIVYHTTNGAGKHMKLNEDEYPTTSSNGWNDTEPTTTVFSLGAWGDVNGNNDNMVAYCWSEVEGFSKFGFYTGNGDADGPFVYCGFKPNYLLFKSASAESHWVIYDSKRNAYNEVDLQLLTNHGNAEASFTRPVDFLSNGFKIRFSAYLNISDDTYIFAAFSESPFKYSNAR